MVNSAGQKQNNYMSTFLDKLFTILGEGDLIKVSDFPYGAMKNLYESKQKKIIFDQNCTVVCSFVSNNFSRAPAAR